MNSFQAGLKHIVMTFFLLATTTIYLVNYNSVLAKTVLFSDPFDDGNSDDWLVIGDPGWNVENNEYGILLNPGLSNSIPSDIKWNYNWTNLSYELSLRGVAGVDKNVLIKFKDKNNFVEIHHNESGIFLEKASTTGGAGIIDFKPVHLKNNTTYKIRVEIQNNKRLKVYIDGDLLFDKTESDPLIKDWRVGLRVGTGSVTKSEVWFDNIRVSSLDDPSPMPTTTPTPTPTSTSSPIPTIPPQVGDWELPINYIGRLLNDADKFKSAFWTRLTAAFDHKFPTGIHTPFTGTSYNPTDCLAGTLGISCYDSHNGTDFSKTGGYEVFSVADGTVAYASRHRTSSCTPNSGGFGCVVIVGYHNNTFGLFAHLKKIFVSKEQSVDKTTILGEMGKTGCAPSCGEHLHFSVLKPASFGTTTQTLLNFMKPKDWESLLSTIRPLQTPKIAVKPYCNYRAPNGQKFIFIDPAGWKGESQDPWSLPKKQKGCGITSPYLWKFDVGINP